MELNIFTGSLKYNDIDFSFVFDKEELRLIPPKEKRFEIEHEWYMHKIGDGCYACGVNDIPTMDEPFIIGQCNENGKKIVFITEQGSSIGKYNSVLLVDVKAYLLFSSGNGVVDCIKFSSPEINCIHPIGQSFSMRLEDDNIDSGVYTIQTADFASTTTSIESFCVGTTSVNAYFGASRIISHGVTETPLKLKSSLCFEFEPTDDYAFIFQLYSIANNLIQFLCYRKNVPFSEIAILSPYEGGKHISSGEMLITSNEANDETELEVLRRGRYIKQPYFNGCVGKILQSISDSTIYLRHLPDTYKCGRVIDASRFIMITAAFEWEVKRIFPNGIEKSEKRIKAEEKVHSILHELMEDGSNTGEVKKILKYLDKGIEFAPLSRKISYVGKELGDVIDVFGNQLYRFNGEKLNYDDMGERLARQRNNFAHGNLDKDFGGLALLDLIYLEFVLYAMQLSFYGIDRLSIQKAINDLFQRHIIFSDIEN